MSAKTTSYKIDSDTIRKMATLAANHLITTPTPPDHIITREFLYDLADFPHKPDVATAAQMEEWSLSELSFITLVRDMVMEGCGRWLLTVRGEGFRLLTPLESVHHGIDSTLKKVETAVKRGSKIVNQSAVTGEAEVAAQSAAQIRLGQMRGVADSVKQLAERDRKFEEAKGNSTRRSLRDEHGPGSPFLPDPPNANK